METKILGLSGRKQSGKNTSANHIVGSFLKTLEIIQGDFKITPKGELWVPDIFGDTEHQGLFDIMSESEGMTAFKKQYLDDIIKVYSYADILKRDACIKILGLTYEQCYGSDADKNTLTKLRWEDMPGVITEKPSKDDKDCTRDIEKALGEELSEVYGRLGRYYDKLANGLVYHEPGFMTAREAMQFVGTEIFRKMYGNVWVDATINQIHKDQPLIALICDVRFHNEVNAILEVKEPTKGKVIRFLRNPAEGKDVHESETALDNYPLERYSAVIDNCEMSVDEQNKAVQQVMTEWEWFPKTYPKE
jgi:hypothetical protein